MLWNINFFFYFNFRWQIDFQYRQKIYTFDDHASKDHELNILCNLCCKTGNAVEVKVHSKINLEIQPPPKKKERKLIQNIFFSHYFENYCASSYFWHRQGLKWFATSNDSCDECNWGRVLPTWNFWRNFKTSIYEIIIQFKPQELA